MSSEKYNSDWVKEVYARIADLVAKEKSPAAFARKTGLIDQTLRKMLDEKTEKKEVPKITTLLKISKGVNVSVDWLLTGKEESYIGDDILRDLQFGKEEKPDSKTINVRVGKAVEQLTGILLSGDTNITKALLTALDSFVFYQKKSQAMKGRLEHTDNTIDEIKKILQESLPPNGVEERRECLVKINKLLMNTLQ